MVVKSAEPHWEEDFNVELEGTRGLRILLYEEDYMQVAVLKGKAEIEVIIIWGTSIYIYCLDPRTFRSGFQESETYLSINQIRTCGQVGKIFDEFLESDPHHF